MEVAQHIWYFVAVDRQIGYFVAVDWPRLASNLGSYCVWHWISASVGVSFDCVCVCVSFI